MDLQPTQDEMVVLNAAKPAAEGISLPDALAARGEYINDFSRYVDEHRRAIMRYHDARDLHADAHLRAATASDDEVEAATAGAQGAADQLVAAAADVDHAADHVNARIPRLVELHADVIEAAKAEYLEATRDKRTHDEEEAGIPWCPAHQRGCANGPHPFITPEQALERFALPQSVKPVAFEE